jgi:NAD(P)-dependent dehydrogenase (short-subunit alcohol dehydrogenase family)
LAGRTAVVVGGGSGWGRAAAVRLAREGAHVAVVDAAAEQVRQVVDVITAEGNSGTGFTCDPADHPGLVAVEGQLTGGRGTVDVLVNNHMHLYWASIEEGDVEEFAAIVRFNLVGPVASTKAFLPALKRAGRGSIVHLGSVDGLYGNPRVPSYSASKGGVVPLTHVMAYEFAPFDIRVNAIASAQTNQVTSDTSTHTLNQLPPGWERFPGDWYTQQLADATPLKRYGSPEEWAGPIAFLASDDAAYVTGSVLVVDCGRTGLTPGTQ